MALPNLWSLVFALPGILLLLVFQLGILAKKKGTGVETETTSFPLSSVDMGGVITVIQTPDKIAFTSFAHALLAFVLWVYQCHVRDIHKLDNFS
jgi:hypothetical protein